MVDYKSLMPSLNPLFSTIRKFTDFSLPGRELSQAENRARREARTQTSAPRQALSSLQRSLMGQRQTSLDALGRHMQNLPSNIQRNIRDLQNQYRQASPQGPASSGQGIRGLLDAGMGAVSEHAGALQQLLGQQGQIENEFLGNLMSGVFQPQRELSLQEGSEAAGRYRDFLTRAQERLFEGRIQEAEALLNEAQREYNAAVRAEEERFMRQQQQYGQNLGAMQHSSPYQGGGNVDAWLKEAIKITGVPMSWLEPLRTIAMKESGGNPNAVNDWDSNAKRGTPSIGLMQTIGPTFNSYKMQGYDNIRNPVHNAIAAIRYIQSRYKTPFNTPGIRSMSQGGSYKGY